MNISEKAQEYLNQLEVGERDDGSTYVYLKSLEGKLYESIHQAHNGRLPDDWTYLTYCHLLEKIVDCDLKTLDDLENARHEIVDGTIDIYTHDLKQWLIDYPNADDYMSETIASHSYSTDGGMWQVYVSAQYLAIDAIMSKVINLLSK
jgi:hypothetical protein